MVATTDIIGHDKFKALDVYGQAVLMYLLCRRNGGTGQCNPSLPDILRLNITRKTLLKKMAELACGGWVKRSPHRGRGHSTEYEIGVPDAPISIIEKGVPDTPIKQQKGVPHALKRGTGYTPNVRTYKDRRRSVTKTWTPDSPEYKLAAALWEDISRNGTAAKKPDLQKWAAVFDSMHRIDQRPYHWLKKIILTAREKDNWLRDNMRSPETARKWINTGRLDKYAPDAWMSDEEVLAAAETSPQAVAA